MSLESPRFLMKRGPAHYVEAYKSLLHLRGLPLLAAKELFYVHCQIAVEKRLLSQPTNDAEQYFSHRKGLGKMYRRGSQALRRRKPRYCDDTENPDSVHKSVLKPNEKIAQKRNGGVASEDEENQRQNTMPDPHNRRYSVRTGNHWKELWQRLAAPHSQSVNYWQKLGQLLTERRIRRVFQVPPYIVTFTNRKIGHCVGRSLYDMSTTLWCQCISIL
jgi:hypothetical protein